MPKGLAVSDVVNVTVDLAPLAAGYRNFGATLILGSTPVIDVVERQRQYSQLEEVEVDFGTNTPEYFAADLFFSQSPRPNLLYIGRWAQTDSPGMLHGAILTPLQQLLRNFTPVTNGAFEIRINGVPHSVNGLNFTDVLNLNGVASVVQAAMPGGVRCVWDSTQSRFDIISDENGLGSSVSYATVPTATGHFTFSQNPAAGNTIVLNGTTVTFRASGATGDDVNIGATLAATLQALDEKLNESTDPQIQKFNPQIVGTSLYLESRVLGVGGNALTLAATGFATASGVNMDGGEGADVSHLFGWSQSVNTPAPVLGIAAESAVDCVAAQADLSANWYAVGFATAVPPSDDDHIAVAGLIEGQGQSRIYLITTQETGTLDSTISADLASILKSLRYQRTLIQYSSSSPYAVFSLFARHATVNFNASNSTITLKFKQEPGIIAEFLTETWAATLRRKNCNVFVNYQNDTAIIEEGVMCGGYFIDERVGADWLQNEIQNDVYNDLYQSFTKIPQTDAGTHVLVNTINTTCSRGVNNGWIAPGVWNAAGFGQLNQGDTLTTGFYTFAPLVATQSQADREKRKSVPIQVAVKLAGAIHSVDVMVTVNR